MPPVLVGAVVGVLASPRGLRLAFAAGAAILMVMVGAMTQAGYAGNLRYVALPAALVCALAGAGWVDLVRGTGRRWGPRAAVARRGARRGGERAVRGRGGRAPSRPTCD